MATCHRQSHLRGPKESCNADLTQVNTVLTDQACVIVKSVQYLKVKVPPTVHSTSAVRARVCALASLKWLCTNEHLIACLVVQRLSLVRQTQLLLLSPAVTGNHKSCILSPYSVTAWRSWISDLVTVHLHQACSRWAPLHCCSSWPARPQEAGYNGVSLFEESGVRSCFQMESFLWLCSQLTPCLHLCFLI
jgi:hypothetical protein